MKRFLPLICLFFSTLTFAQEDLPPNAVPGKCYAKCFIPPQFETLTVQVLLKEAATRIEIVPAAYVTEEQQILVKEAYEVLEIVPAQFITQTEQIMVREPSERLEYVPPVFETVTEHILITPAQTKWVKLTHPKNCFSAKPKECMEWCLTEIPAQYKTIYKQFLRSPATTRSTPVPAEYKTITKAVVSGKGTQIKKRKIPAQYRTITKYVLQSPATTREVEVPAEYGLAVIKSKTALGGQTDWVEVLCDEY